jgi:hypothetical protein
VREDELFLQCSDGFYVFLVVCLQQIGCVNVIGWFPHVIAFGVPLPFDEVL